MLDTFSGGPVSHAECQKWSGGTNILDTCSGIQVARKGQETLTSWTHFQQASSAMQVARKGVTERVRDGCGLRKERGKRAEADRERIGRASERTGSRRTWLQLVRCALVHTGVLFRKSRSDRKGNRGNRSRYSDWRYRRKHLSIYTNYVFHMEQVRRDREWKS
jgi:hypothetical protein